MRRNKQRRSKQPSILYVCYGVTAFLIGVSSFLLSRVSVRVASLGEASHSSL